jgi:hypothetical protein
MEVTMSILKRLGALVGVWILGLGAAVLVAVGPGAAGPAQAAPPDAWGFAYLHDPAPAPGTVLDPTRQWGSWKTAFPADFATVDHVATGNYVVRFPHIGVPGGVAHVTAVVGSRPIWCGLGKWFERGGDEYVEVQCWGIGGIPVDSRFGIVFSAKFAPLVVLGGGYAYTHVDAAGTLLDSYNSAGGTNAASAGGAGTYKVLLPGVGVAGAFAGNVQVTAAEPDRDRRCKVADVAVARADVVVYVACFDGLSAPADSAFTLTYHRERPVFGEVAPPKRFAYTVIGAVAPPGTDFNSAGAPNTVTPSGVGLTLVVFGQVGIRETHLQVTAVGGRPDFCSLQDVWRNIGQDGVIRNVICFDAAGSRADNAAFVTFSSRV